MNKCTVWMLKSSLGFRISRPKTEKTGKEKKINVIKGFFCQLHKKRNPSTNDKYQTKNLRIKYYMNLDKVKTQLS